MEKSSINTVENLFSIVQAMQRNGAFSPNDEYRVIVRRKPAQESPSSANDESSWK